VPDRHVVEFETCDQYTIQGDLLSRAVLDGRPAPYPLEDSLANMRVIDALFRSGQSGGWEPVGRSN
jgi:predicted dehydrogenase